MLVRVGDMPREPTVAVVGHLPCADGTVGGHDPRGHPRRGLRHGNHDVLAVLLRPRRDPPFPPGRVVVLAKHPPPSMRGPDGLIDLVLRDDPTLASGTSGPFPNVDHEPMAITGAAEEGGGVPGD